MKKLIAVSLGLAIFVAPISSLANTNTASTVLSPASSQYWSINNQDQTNLGNWGTGPFTISGWIKPSVLDGLEFIVKKRNTGGGDPGYSLLTASNKLAVYTAQGVGPAFYLESDQTLNTDSWQQVSVTRDENGNVILYINGQPSGIGQTSMNVDTTERFTIGSSNNPEYLFNGKVDDIRTWTRPLSSAEITNLYSNPCSFSNGSNLVGWWQFENNGSDSSGNNNNLIAQGSPVAGFTVDVPYSCGPTLPTASPVSISSSNASSTIARFGDIVTLKFTTSVPVRTPLVKIEDRPALVLKGKNNAYMAATIMLPLDPEGSIPFSIQLTDTSGNKAPAITATTDGSSVYHYHRLSKKICNLPWLPKPIKNYFCN